MKPTEDYHKMQKCEYYQSEECDCLTECSVILKESTDHIADVGKMVGKTDPSTEQESQEELWNEAQNFVKNHLGTYSNDLVCDLARWAIEEMKKHYIITRKP